MPQAVVLQSIENFQYRTYPKGQVVDFPAVELAWLKSRNMVDDGAAVVAAAIAGGAFVTTHVKRDSAIVKPKSIADRLLAARASVIGRNPIESGVLAAPPTVSINPADPGGLTTNTKWRPSTRRDAFRIRGTGGVAFEENISGTGYIRFVSERTNTAGGRAIGLSGWDQSIVTDSRYVWFECLGNASYSYRIFIRNLLTGEAGLTALAGHLVNPNAALVIDFGAAGTWREITLIMVGDMGIRSVRVDESASVVAPIPDDLSILTKGDSFTWGSISPQPAYAGVTMVAAMRALMGCDVIGHGIGASGWVAGNSLQNAYRIEDMAAVHADLNLLPMGCNDVGVASGVTFRDSVKWALNAMCAAGIDAPILGFGPFPGSKMSAGASTNKTNLLQVEADLMQAFEEFGHPRIKLVPINTEGASTPWGGRCVPWVEGTRDTDTATGDAGNSQVITGNDGTHNSASGALYKARRIMEETIRTCVYQGW